MAAAGDAARAVARVLAATAADRARIVDFLRAEFFSAEPMNAAADTRRGPADERYIGSLSALEDGTALLAEDADGAMLGVCLCAQAAARGEGGAGGAAAEAAGGAGAFACVLAALGAAAEAAARSWSPAKGARVLEVRVLAVGRRARRRGLAAQLLAAARGAALRGGYDALAMLCTSAFSAALAARAGMRLVHAQPYAALAAPGLLPRAPPAPHTHVTLYVQELRGAAAAAL